MAAPHASVGEVRRACAWVGPGVMLLGSLARGGRPVAAAAKYQRVGGRGWARSGGRGRQGLETSCLPRLQGTVAACPGSTGRTALRWTHPLSSVPCAPTVCEPFGEAAVNKELMLLARVREMDK